MKPNFKFIATFRLERSATSMKEALGFRDRHRCLRSADLHEAGNSNENIARTRAQQAHPELGRRVQLVVNCLELHAQALLFGLDRVSRFPVDLLSDNYLEERTVLNLSNVYRRSSLQSLFLYS